MSISPDFRFLGEGGFRVDGQGTITIGGKETEVPSQTKEARD